MKKTTATQDVLSKELQAVAKIIKSAYTKGYEQGKKDAQIVCTDFPTARIRH